MLLMSWTAQSSARHALGLLGGATKAPAFVPGLATPPAYIRRVIITQ
jgi:hypothetical protein